MDIIPTLTNILRLAPELIILGFCIQYVHTKKTTDGVLLTIGTAIGLLVMIFYTFIYPHLYDSDLFTSGSIIFTAVSFAGWAGQVVFAIGLILLLRKAILNWTNSPSPRYNDNPEGPLDEGMRR
jgi:hypothetical protein